MYRLWAYRGQERRGGQERRIDRFFTAREGARRQVFIKSGSGKLGVKVKMDGNTIPSVEVASNHETTGISGKALVEIPQEIVQNQSTNVDVVSGTTVTSKGVISVGTEPLVNGRRTPRKI
jgi:Na+-translocating ferredoxin:NAD+ oxidoreductase RnfG subunit